MERYAEHQRGDKRNPQRAKEPKRIRLGDGGPEIPDRRIAKDDEKRHANQRKHEDHAHQAELFAFVCGAFAAGWGCVRFGVLRLRRMHILNHVCIIPETIADCQSGNLKKRKIIMKYHKNAPQRALCDKNVSRLGLAERGLRLIRQRGKRRFIAVAGLGVDTMILRSFRNAEECGVSHRVHDLRDRIGAIPDRQEQRKLRPAIGRNRIKTAVLHRTRRRIDERHGSREPCVFDGQHAFPMYFQDSSSQPRGRVVRRIPQRQLVFAIEQRVRTRGLQLARAERAEGKRRGVRNEEPSAELTRRRGGRAAAGKEVADQISRAGGSEDYAA